ncbi:hypothetical protein EDC04DRAFT_2911577 [Pisolithus marmoratus]|nr:hypothetical protein EDC04DRAFT_2911577 [Pisolithus marmoratus]
MTAHWIAEEAGTGLLRLRSALLAFHQIHGSHTGKSLAKTILYLLDCTKITAKAWAHAFPGEEEWEAYLEAVRSDPISRGCDITGNLRNWFKGCAGEALQVPELELLQDVRTCWDSSCIMNNRLCTLQPAIDYFLALLNQKELEGYAFSPSQWLILEDFECILQKGPTGTSQSPAENVKEALGETNACLKPWTDVGLKWAVEYYQHMDSTRAYVVAMYKYVASAERMLLQLMHEYRQKLPMPAKAQQKGKGSVHTIDSLTAHFGIKDMGTKMQPQPLKVVTPDDEYYSYINGDLWDDGLDPLKFWEAGGLFPSPVLSSSLLVTKQSKRKAYPTIFA